MTTSAAIAGLRRRFKGDFIDIANNVTEATKVIERSSYDAIFLDHDLHPEHYHADSTDDERTGYAVALWLCSNPELQRASTILVHTRNADGAMRMVGRTETRRPERRLRPISLAGGTNQDLLEPLS